jgi:hypothetical protein
MKKLVVGGLAAGVLVLGVALGASGDNGSDAASDAPASGQAETAPTKKPQPEKRKTSSEITFKVWGSAPSGVDINYGTDSDSRGVGVGPTSLPFKKTMKYDADAMYYSIDAQLDGRGDIYCSVTYKGETKTGHASGSYNICMVQLNAGLFGGLS